MNVDIVRALKAANVKVDNKPRTNESKDDSFLKSLNKFLEKNNLKDSKEVGRVRRDLEEVQEDKDDSFNYLGILNTNPLMTNNYPDETNLNKESGLELLVNPELGLKGLSEEAIMEELVNPGLEPDGELKNLNLLEEGKTIPQNFSLEEAKINLDKALAKEVVVEDKNILESEQLADRIIGENKVSNLDNKETLIKPETAAALGETISKEELTKPIESTVKQSSLDNLDAKVSGAEKVLVKPDTGVDLVEADEVNTEAESLDFDKLLEGSVKLNGAEEELEEVVASKTTETPKNIETDFIMNRIQNSFSNIDEIEKSMSPQNLQNIQDKMIHFMKVSKEGDASMMKVRLYPEELGSIDISLKFQNGKLMADIIVQSESIKEMFLNGSNLLNKNLLEQNIPIKNINVTVDENLNSFENQSGQAGHGQGRESHTGRSLNRSNIVSGNVNQNPIDDMRIDRINKAVKGLDILV